MKSPKFPFEAGRIAAAAIIAVLFSAAAQLPAESLNPEHGNLDVYAKDGISLAWAVLRDKAGSDPENDDVVLRIASNPAAASSFRAEGVDPFSGDRTPIAAGRFTEKPTDVLFKRSHFALYPKTEIFFFKFPEPGDKTKAARLIFFVGLPDTTPEFLAREKMEIYLKERLKSSF